MGGEEDDGEVDGDEDAVLDAVAVFDKKVGAEAGLVARADEVVEADEALFEFLGRVAVQAGEDDGEDCGEVLLDDGPGWHVNGRE